MFLFLWLASKKHRLQPWNSPYLRWRLETYTGVPAEGITAQLFFKLLWAERRSMLHYLAWVHRSRKLLR